jgi:probable HAF family extracellular repeat protein
LHAAIWQGGAVRDLGTLGGPDSLGNFLDARGQVAGESFTSSTPGPFGIPPMDPFLWDHGVMHDLGTFGGTFALSSWMNDHGEVVGFSDLAGDQVAHPFLWNGGSLIDLGTLGGDNGQSYWVNDSGSVVGSADVPGSQIHHGFLWANGIMRDLPPTGDDPCANAFVINARGQAVGNDTDCAGTGLNAMLWQNGSAFNLNAQVDSTPLHLTEAFFISARGEIACLATLPNGDEHVALLRPESGASSGSRMGSTTATGSTPDARDLLQTLPERIRQLSGPQVR